MTPLMLESWEDVATMHTFVFQMIFLLLEAFAQQLASVKDCLILWDLMSNK